MTKAGFHPSIKDAVKSLKKHAPDDLAKFVVVQISETQFDIQHKTTVQPGANIVMDGADIQTKATR